MLSSDYTPTCYRYHVCAKSDSRYFAPCGALARDRELISWSLTSLQWSRFLSI